jgi:predicted nucleic acid-binding protein
MVFIDTNVLLAYLLEGDKFQKDAENLLFKIQKGGVKAEGSVMSLLEISYILKKHRKSNNEIAKTMHAILSIENMKFLPITSDLVREAADFTDIYGLNLSDAIILATAMRLSLKEIISEDSDFDKVPIIKRISMKSFERQGKDG